MTKKEFWLKLFNENDTALAFAITLCERFVTEEQLERGQEYLMEKKKELYEKVPEEDVKKVFDDFRDKKQDRKITNLDVIRELSAEEIAPKLIKPFTDYEIPFRTVYEMPNGKSLENYDNALEKTIIWLKQEV